MTKIQTTRVYVKPAPDDGFRILADRLWPRGLKKDAVPYDMWAKQLAPTDELRRWFHEDPAARWQVFQEKYLVELRQNPNLPEFIGAVRQHPVVTLLFAAKDTEHNQAVVLKHVLEQPS